MLTFVHTTESLWAGCHISLRGIDKPITGRACTILVCDFTHLQASPVQICPCWVSWCGYSAMCKREPAGVCSCGECTCVWTCMCECACECVCV